MRFLKNTLMFLGVLMVLSTLVFAVQQGLTPEADAKMSGAAESDDRNVIGANLGIDH